MADNLAVKNEYGSITVTKSVLAQIVTEVIEETKGVNLASLKRMLKSGRSNMEVSFGDDGAPEIKAYVIVDFGTSISVTVVGTQTRRSIIKRHIEVKRSYDNTD